MNNKTSQLMLGIAIVVAIGATAAWYRAHAALSESRSRVVAGLLEPTARMIRENEALTKELQAEPYAEKDAAILVAYLSRIRRDGVPKHAAMRQRLEQIAENNVAIATLLGAYLPYAQSSGLAVEVDKFRNHAAAWRDRWNSVMEIFMAGGSYGTVEVPYPPALRDKVDAEITALR